MSAKEAPATDLLTEDYFDKLNKIKELYGLLHSQFIYSSPGKKIANKKVWR